MTRSIALLAALVLVNGARAADFDGVRGTTMQIKGELAVTFWSDYPSKYMVFESGKEQILIASPKIKAPAGWTVAPETVTVTKQQGSHSNYGPGTQTTFTYDQYVIRGVWNVTIPAHVADGKHGITIQFPEIDDTALQVLRDRNKPSDPFSYSRGEVKLPKSDSHSFPRSTMSMDVIVHATPEAMAATIAERKAEAERAEAERNRTPWYVYLLLLIPGLPVLMVVWAVGSVIVGSLRPKPAPVGPSSDEFVPLWTTDYRTRI